MLKSLTQYGIFTFLGAAVILLLSFVIENGIKQVDEMLVPCQHGTSFVQGRCRCEGTPFNGSYCSNCKCEHGICSTDPTTPFRNSDYGCKCPTQTKHFGYLCELCNTEDTACKGNCKPDFFGSRCERICYANLPYINDNEVCNTMRSSGGQCNTCHGHGTCNDGFCECDDNWFDDGRNQCVQTCPGTPACSGHGVCELYGNTPGCLCEPGWNGPACDIPCPGVIERGTSCSGNGICRVNFDTKQATCECAEKFRGSDCSIECPGDVVSCNGHGTCDDKGVCTCQTNVKWSSPSCKCSDELTCNGKGSCNPDELCECFGNFQGGSCLECKTNYHGDNCDLFCDPMTTCNGHGTCNVVNNKIRCACDYNTEKTVSVNGILGNYVSYYSDELFCGECLPEYYPKASVVKSHGLPNGFGVECQEVCTRQSTCNDAGNCNPLFGKSGENMCLCDNENMKPEAFCTECKENWYSSINGNCDKFCVASGSLPSACDGTVDCVQCNGHGTCSGEGDCLCTGGYRGDNCQILCETPDGKECSGHGSCVTNDVQQLMEHEFLKQGIPTSSCECNPQDPVDADARLDFAERLSQGLVNGTLDPPPDKEYYGQLCEFHCMKPPWPESSECNSMGNCTTTVLRLPDNSFVSCVHDSDCKNNTAIQQMVSGDSEWSDKKGPFCYKPDEISGCQKSTDDCYEILLKQRPKKMRNEECVKGGDVISTSGLPSKALSWSECKEYADATDDLKWSGNTSWSVPPEGCYSSPNQFGDDLVYYNTFSSGVSCSSQYYCIQLSCFDAIESENWHQYCTNIDGKLQPPKFEGCESVGYLCNPVRSISPKCHDMVNLTDGTDVSYKLNLAYEYDKRRYPFKISEIYRSNESAASHDEAEAAFKSFVTQNNVDMTLPNDFCPNYVNRYSISTVRENKQYLCNGVLTNTSNCSGVLTESLRQYKPFVVTCLNTVTEYTTYNEAIRNRGSNCKISEIQKDLVYTNNTDEGKSYIDSTCENIDNMFPQCRYPKPCDFNPCSDSSYTCTNDGTKAICETTGDLNSTCKKGNSTRLSFTSYSCDIQVGDTSCTVKSTFHTNKAKHCIDNNPIVSYIEHIGENKNESFNANGAKYIHFQFKAADTTSTATRLNFGSIIIYIRQGQIQLNEVQSLQACPINNQFCHDDWAYEKNNWYHIELEMNATHVTMIRKDTQKRITKQKLNSDDIKYVFTEPGSSVAEYRYISAEKVIPTPFTCSYETCNFDVSYREVCSDIIRNVHYPSLLDQNTNILETCSLLHQRKILPIQENFQTTEQIYNLNWDTYCKFYNEIKSNLNVNYIELEEYTNCQPIIDPLDGNKTCIVNALENNWTATCEELNDAIIPDNIKRACPNTCYNHLLTTDDYCEDRYKIFSSGNTVIDTCQTDWYDYCLKDAKNTLVGKCAAVECVCDEEKYEGVTGESCQLHCPLAFDGSPCAEKSSMGICQYTSDQKEILKTARKDADGNYLAFSKSDWALEGECQCFLTEGTSNCDVECEGCNNGTYSINNYTGQIGICDSTRGVCDCLPPFVQTQQITYRNWRGTNVTRLEYSYNDGGVKGKDLFRLRMLQGVDAFVREALQMYKQTAVSVPSQVPQSIEIYNNGTSSYVINGTNNPDIEICLNAPITFIRKTAGHIFRVVNASDCPSCVNGSYSSLPNSSLANWVDITGLLGTGSVCTSNSECIDNDCRGKCCISTLNDANCGVCGSTGWCESCATGYTWVAGQGCTGNSSSPSPSPSPSYRHRLRSTSQTYTFTEAGTYYYVCTSHSSMVGKITVKPCSTSTPATTLAPAYDSSKTIEEVWIDFRDNPKNYYCYDRPCDYGDSNLVSNLAGESSRFNYDCNSVCPGTNPVSLIPCSGHGSCGPTGQCICDQAKVVVGENENGFKQVIRAMPGVSIVNSGLKTDRLDLTGYRGEGCEKTCKGYDEVLGDMSTICNGRGKCNLAGECECNVGYIGDECQFACPSSDNTTLCNGHGTCEFAEINILIDTYDESNHTCDVFANEDQCYGYAILNDLELVDIAGIREVGANEICSQITQAQCEWWNKAQDLSYNYRGNISNTSYPKGCIVDIDNHDIYYNDHTEDIACGDKYNCLCQKSKPENIFCKEDGENLLVHTMGGSDFKETDGKWSVSNYENPIGYKSTSGPSDYPLNRLECAKFSCTFGNCSSIAKIVQNGQNIGSMTRDECIKWTNETGRTWYIHSTTTYAVSTFPSGCWIYAHNGQVYYNNANTAVQCNSIYQCVQKVDFENRFALHTYNSYANTVIKTSGSPDLFYGDLSLSQAECKQYATDNNLTFGVADETGNPRACFRQSSNVYYNKNTATTASCGAHGVSNCVQRQPYGTIPCSGENDCALKCDRSPECKGYHSRNGYEAVPFWEAGCGTTCTDKANCEALCQSSNTCVGYASFMQTTSTYATCRVDECIQFTSSGRCSLWGISFKAHPSCGFLQQEVFQYGSGTCPYAEYVLSFKKGKTFFYGSTAYNGAISGIPLGKSTSPTDWFNFTELGFDYVESGANDMSTSFEQCKEYSNNEGLTWVSDNYVAASGNPPGCFRYSNNIYYNKQTDSSKVINCDATHRCLFNRGKYFPTGCVKAGNHIHWVVSGNADSASSTNTNPIGGLGGNTGIVSGLPTGVSRIEHVYYLDRVKQQCRQDEKCLGIQEDPPGSNRWHKITNSLSVITGSSGGFSPAVFSSGYRCSNCGSEISIPRLYNKDDATKICAGLARSDSFVAFSVTSLPDQDFQCCKSTNCDTWEEKNIYTESYVLQESISGEKTRRYIKNPINICVKEDAKDVDAKTQAPVLKSLRKNNDQCRFLITGGVCLIKATERDCYRYNNSMIVIDRADRPHGCFEDGGKLMYNKNTGVNCSIAYPSVCKSNLYKDKNSNKCVGFSQEPIIDITLYTDQGKSYEETKDIECQVNSNTKITCAQCNCFDSDVYGTWSGYECETCAKGYGKSQCVDVCPDYDGENDNTMCSGFGKCLYGSELNQKSERVFQEANCICGQDDYYQSRIPSGEVVAEYPSSQSGYNNYFYNEMQTNGLTYSSYEDATTACSKFNDISLASIGGYCYGVFVKNAPTNAFVFELAMQITGNKFITYYRYYEKRLTSSASFLYNIETRDLIQKTKSFAKKQLCKSDIDIAYSGIDSCNHFSSDIASCSKCEKGWTGKNCRAKCNKCLFGGICSEAPGETEGASCQCSGNSEGLWEHECCPIGFMITSSVNFNSLSDEYISQIKLPRIFDEYTTNEFDSSFYCRKCPGVTGNDWLETSASYKVCSGPSRGTCEAENGNLVCKCKINSASGSIWQGRACSCHDSLTVAYNPDINIQETTDYGCLIPTKGTGTCPRSTRDDDSNYYFVPPLWMYSKSYYNTHGYSNGDRSYVGYSTDPAYPFHSWTSITDSKVALTSTYILAETVEAQLLKPFSGAVASDIYVTTSNFQGFTGEGPCNTDADCQGTLTCFDRDGVGAGKTGYNVDYVSPTLKFCVDPNENRVGCVPLLETNEGIFDRLEDSNSLNILCEPFDLSSTQCSKEFLKSRLIKTNRYWDGEKYVTAPLGSFVPFTKDGNGDLVIHKQAFPCPKGTYGGEFFEGYELEARMCIKCRHNQYQDETGKTTCKSCPSTKFYHGVGATSISFCDGCNPGYKLLSSPNSQGQMCEICPSGKYESGFVCYPCSSGQYTDQNGQTSCKHCAAGQNTVGAIGMTSCTPCPTGSVNPLVNNQNDGRCDECPAGKYTDDNTVGCKSCSNGKYSLRLATGCKDCPAGRYGSGTSTAGDAYATREDVNACTNCPVGKYSTTIAATSANTCDSCPADHAGAAPDGNNYAPSSSSVGCFECTGCKEPNAGKTNCINPPPYFYQVATGYEAHGSESSEGTYSCPCYGCNSGTHPCIENCFHKCKNKKIANVLVGGFVVGKGGECYCELYGGEYAISQSNYKAASYYNMFTIISCPGNGVRFSYDYNLNGANYG